MDVDLLGPFGESDLAASLYRESFQHPQRDWSVDAVRRLASFGDVWSWPETEEQANAVLKTLADRHVNLHDLEAVLRDVLWRFVTLAEPGCVTVQCLSQGVWNRAIDASRSGQALERVLSHRDALLEKIIQIDGDRPGTAPLEFLMLTSLLYLYCKAALTISANVQALQECPVGIRRELAASDSWVEETRVHRALDFLAELTRSPLLRREDAVVWGEIGSGRGAQDFDLVEVAATTYLPVPL